jgi:hypothetical protein
MGTIVSGTHTIGITLSSTPTTIAGTIALTGTGSTVGVLGSATTSWDVTNIGAIEGTQFGDVGIQIDGSGTLYNGTATGSTAEIIAYSYGVELGASRPPVAGTVVNYGTIISTGAAFGAVDLNGGGRVVNAADGLISGLATYYGVYTGTRASTVTNAGTIAGGVWLRKGGIVSNAAGGSIIGYNAVYASSFATVSNAGLIEGSTTPGSAGVDLNQGGSLVNSAGGTISGGYGVYIGGLAGSVINAGYIGGTVGIDLTSSGGVDTVINSGTIASSLGASGNAIVFTNTADRLVVDKGAEFIGTVVGAGVLELAHSTGKATLAGVGTAVTGFATIAFDAGGTWLVGGNSIGFDGTITGFTLGDTLDITAISATTPLFAADTLTLENGSGTVVDRIDLAGNFSSSQFLLQPDQTDGTMISLLVPCFVPGTRIATPSGDAAVEDLTIGDHVTLLSGGSKPIKWIGRRSYDGRFAGANPAILPIIIRAGALADGQPARDLRVSPKHAMYFDGILIPAEKLINGKTILQSETVDSLTYIHLELDDHEVIFADGAATESFIDCDSRMMFQNAHEFAELYPGDQASAWEFCAPRIEVGEALARVRRDLAARAACVRTMHADISLDGRVDTVNANRVTGWAFDATEPDTPVLLEILDYDRVIGECLADRYRPDLAHAGIGNGHCSFIFTLHGSPRSRRIRARRKSDGADIPSPPLFWQRPADHFAAIARKKSI